MFLFFVLEKIIRGHGVASLISMDQSVLGNLILLRSFFGSCLTTGIFTEKVVYVSLYLTECTEYFQRQLNSLLESAQSLYILSSPTYSTITSEDFINRTKHKDSTILQSHIKSIKFSNTHFHIDWYYYIVLLEIIVLFHICLYLSFEFNVIIWTFCSHVNNINILFAYFIIILI